MMTCYFYQRKFVGKLWTLFIMSITKGITDGIFHRYFPESSRTIHFSIALLIIVLYRQCHNPIFDPFILIIIIIIILFTEKDKKMMMKK